MPKLSQMFYTLARDLPRRISLQKAAVNHQVTPHSLSSPSVQQLPCDLRTKRVSMLPEAGYDPEASFDYTVLSLGSSPSSGAAAKGTTRHLFARYPYSLAS